MVSVALGGLAACVGGAQTSGLAANSVSDQPTAKVARSRATLVLREPAEIGLRVKQLGSALNVEIVALGRGRLEGEPFEDPSNWTITAVSRGKALQRVVNGPVRLGRSPVGRASGNRWDVDLRFSLNYALPKKGGAVTIKVTDPDGVSKTRTVRVR